MNYLVYLLFACGSCAALQAAQVLCADIGGTRAKAAVLHTDITLEELKAVRTVAIDSGPWLSEELPLIFSSQVANNLRQKIDRPFDQICFGVRGPVKDGTFCVVPKEHLPHDIKRLCSEAASCPVFVECDTGIWSRGAVYFQELIGEEVSFPCLGATFGTGIGVALIRSESDIANIEISVIDSPFQRLLASAEDQPIKQEYARPALHDVIGMPFFNWAKQARAYDEATLKADFDQRVIAFFQDMLEWVEGKLGSEVKSIMLGGGNARFIDVEKLQSACGKKVISLSPQRVAKHGISPDIVSLLGCLKLPENSPVEMIPSWEEMLPWYVE